MKLMQRGPTWYVEFRADGRRFRLSTGEGNEAAAIAAAAEIIRRHCGTAGATLSGREPALGETLGVLLERVYRTRWQRQASATEKRYQIGAVMRDRVARLPIADVGYAVLRDYGERLLASGLTHATHNRYMSTISTALREAAREGLIPYVPQVPTLSEDNVTDRYLSDDEEAALLTWMDAHTAPADHKRAYVRHLVALLLDTGMRLGEARALRADWLTRTEGGTVSIILPHHVHGQFRTKSGRGRAIPLTTRAVHAAESLLASPVHGQITASSIRHYFGQACDACGIKGVVIHTLRHTCATRLGELDGITLHDIRDWCGHASITTTERYAHRTGARLAGLAGALERRRGAADGAPATAFGDRSGAGCPNPLDGTVSK